MSKILLVIGIILVIFFGLGWILNRGAFPKPSPNNPPSNQPTQVTNQSSTATSLSPDSCDPSLWNYIPLPKTKLKILDQCKTVTGTIETIQTEGDGDYHIGLKLDSQYANLINSQNNLKQDGNLVLETICQVKIDPNDEPAVVACSGYSGPHFQIPPVGTHVKVTGSYVIDNGEWAEIHPVSQIKSL